MIIFLCTSSSFNDGGVYNRISLPSVSSWAKTVDDKLVKLNEMFVVVNNTFQKKAKGSLPSPGLNFTYEVLNETEVVKEMAASVSELLHRHMKALEKSVKAAEAAAAAYKWNNNLMKDDVTYMNSKELDEKDVELTYSDKFGRRVNFNFSSVHIPVEIYDGNIDILNGLNWTAALEDQFKKNQEEDPDILWQYFGSQTGFLRTYPAAEWRRDEVDLYDVRRQSWYTQGSSSPKDMLILIDTSGSTHGQSLQLMQNAVKSILATLGENDYVNIVAFAEEANFVSKCFNHTAFVQANFRNKRRLIKDIDKLMAFGQADFTQAIQFAFEKFNEFSNNGTNVNNVGANCNKVIMLLTDGGTDTAEDVFEKYNWPNKTVRVFTYAVGPTPNPVKALRWMACANRGYFSQIPAMGAIRARVQDFMSILDGPLALASAKFIHWTSTHREAYYVHDS
ncbi:unnamed protein product, partial [Candidula unifasciata]